jgi:hypothetical protein
VPAWLTSIYFVSKYRTTEYPKCSNICESGRQGYGVCVHQVYNGMSKWATNCCGPIHTLPLYWCLNLDVDYRKIKMLSRCFPCSHLGRLNRQCRCVGPPLSESHNWLAMKLKILGWELPLKKMLVGPLGITWVFMSWVNIDQWSSKRIRMFWLPVPEHARLRHFIFPV